MPRLALIDRERLLTRLRERFDKRVIVVRAGAGFGKTTLLGQALASNDQDRRGHDVWIDLDAKAISTHGLAAIVSEALGCSLANATVEDVANAVLQRAPQHVALIFDNVHRLDADAVSASFEQLLAALPSNGHVVAAGRTDPPFRFRRLLASGEADLVTEDDLSFNAADTQRFAQIREVGVDHLGPSGWPALLELRAIDQQVDERQYVAEEVLAGIDGDRLRALRRLAVLSSFDDAMVERIGGYSGTAEELVQGLPLANHGASGEVVLHDLWPTWLPPLSAAEYRDVCSRIARLRQETGELTGAFEMFCQAEEFDQATALLRRFACDYNTELTIAARHELLAIIPDALTDHAAVRLIEADLSFVVNPHMAGLPLSRALAAADQANDDELVAQVMLRQGEILYRSNEAQRLTDLLTDLRKRSHDQLAVRAAEHLMEIWLAMAAGRLEEVGQHVDQNDVLAYGPTALQALSFRGLAYGQRGDARKCLRALDELPPFAGRHAANVAGFRTVMKFVAGEMNNERLEAVHEMLAVIKHGQNTHTFVGGSAATAIYNFAAGDIEAARAVLADAHEAVDSLAAGAWARISFECARAMNEIIAGDEESATRRLQRALPAANPFDGVGRHIAYMAVVPLYLLVPASRVYFDADNCGPDFAHGRRVARALTALREESDGTQAAALAWDQLDRIRTWVTEPHLIELAVGAMTWGTPAASHALSSVRYDPHTALHAVRERYDGAITRAAHGLLLETPERPLSSVRVEVLGDTRLVVDGEVLQGRQLRNRVVELLHLLVEHRTISRSRVAAEFWPDLDQDRAQNNLRVNLSLLVRIFEPNRRRGAPPWHVRSEGERIELVSSPLLEIDVDEFTHTMTRARLFERQGRPQEAQVEYVQAVAMYRGDYLERTATADIGFETRIGLQLDVLEAAARAAALLTARGNPIQAIPLARRAIGIDPLAEAGHIALLTALDEAELRAELKRAALRCAELFTAERLEPTAELARLLMNSSRTRV